MLDTVFIGVDVSSQTNVVHVMDRDGDKLWSGKYPNSREGTAAVIEKLKEQPQCKDAFYRFALEATGCFGDGLVMYLRETPDLPRQRTSVQVLNPKRIKKFHDAYSDLPKDDSTDAFVIADSLRFGRIGQKGPVVEYKYLSLQRLTRWRYQCAKELTREKNRYLRT